MLCKKCKKEIPDNSVYCNFCGKKQITAPKSRHRKKANGSGTILKDSRYKKPYLAYSPSTSHGAGRIYLGSFSDVKAAQSAIDDFVKKGRPDLYNATLNDIYKLWSDIHYKRVGDSAINLYTCMYKRFSKIGDMKIIDLKTAHFQEIVNAATSKSAAEITKALAVMLCNCAIENDIIQKNYAEFVKMPKFEKKEKIIFTEEQIKILWGHINDKRVQIILSMIYMGFRIGEVITIKAQNVYLPEGYIICGIKTEAGKNRIVPFPQQIPEIKQFFESWLQNVSDGEQLLFPYSQDHFRDNIFYQVLVDFGILRAKKVKKKWIFESNQHLTPHSTRHTFASLAASSGVSPDSLQRIIGHAQFATTADIYIHNDVNRLRKEMSKLKK